MAGHTRVDGVEVLGSLSPSRAADFRTCPLMFRLRTIDHLPEAPSPEALRGTVVHKVLEDLFDLPAAERTPDRAQAMLHHAWEQVLESEPGVAEMFTDAAGDTASAGGIVEWLSSCRDSLRAYFGLEDPRRLEPAEREVYVETLLDSRLLLRGFVDRIDVAADGALRVVDYKSGRSAAVGFEGKALFQMRFYALVLWRTRGVIPRLLQLIYLGDGQMLSYEPDEQDLLATERLVEALWRRDRAARESGEWLPAQELGSPAPGAASRRGAPSAAAPLPPLAGAGAARPAGSGDLVPLGPERGRRPVGDADGGEDRGEVRLHGALADPEPAGDLLVGQPVAHQQRAPRARAR